MELVARHYRNGEWVGITIDGSRVASVRRVAGEPENRAEDDWVAPAFWDIQLNGRWGHSFSSPELTVEQVAEIVRAQAGLGTARLCPTLITAPIEDTLHGLRTIADACEQFPDVAARVIGIHLEGPFLSERDGYRGAHPREAIRDPDWKLFQSFQEASGKRVVLMTVAPERPGAIEFIRRATAEGVVIALGHTAADTQTLLAAVEAGATLSTHLGNGIAAELPRHPNPIWNQGGEDRLSASLIADGHHLDGATLRVLARAKGPARTILVSDASPLAGLPPGTYGAWAVDPSGKIVVAGTPYLAGSNQGLDVGLRNLLAATGWDVQQAIDTVTRNPARVLWRTAPEIASAQPANLVVFQRSDAQSFVLKRTCVEGNWTEPPP